ncbi:UBX domain-containing protein [Babesia ovis]|uniref:UBX domain-containing protein n=1 Tax=Babesia ovis TaxID=5869 RepID=A0A9W5WVW9_BABOV|nr:UBX domain-containing protein [Babesia ovis]
MDSAKTSLSVASHCASRLYGLLRDITLSFINCCYVTLTVCHNIICILLGVPSSAFRKQFESRHGTVHPKFYEGSFQSAKSLAFRNGKLLAVYLHPGTNKNSSDQFLTNELLTELLDANFVFYVGHGKGPRMRRLIHEFSARRLPHMSVVIMKSEVEYTLIATVEDFSSIDEVIATIANAVDNPLRSLQSDLGNPDANRQLINEQDEALTKAMEADICRIRAKELQATNDLQRNRIREDNLRKREEVIRNRKSFAKTFSGPKPTGDTKIKVRLPSGCTIESVFDKDDTVEKLYEWAGAAEYFSAKSVKIPYNFDLSTMYPSKTLSDRSQTLESANLCPNASLVLISRDDTDEEDM